MREAGMYRVRGEKVKTRTATYIYCFGRLRGCISDSGHRTGLHLSTAFDVYLTDRERNQASGHGRKRNSPDSLNSKCIGRSPIAYPRQQDHNCNHKKGYRSGQSGQSKDTVL